MLVLEGRRVRGVEVIDLPHSVDKRLDVESMEIWWREWQSDGYLCAVFVEDFLIRYATASHHRSSQNYGRLLGGMELRGVEYEKVPPAQWKRRMDLLKQPKKASVAKAREVLGELCPVKLRHDEADALLIAYDGYIRRIA